MTYDDLLGPGASPKPLDASDSDESEKPRLGRLFKKRDVKDPITNSSSASTDAAEYAAEMEEAEEELDEGVEEPDSDEEDTKANRASTKKTCVWSYLGHVRH